ncbi:DUF4160 domain-containing protein [Rhodoplanes elegans]|uniref:DUF4160 domain-containing protein n=1 Tax=Rhodoplanes elegans TaxID=29408 RepID=UPI001FCFFCF5|nr:DUF4160 domain-containing protein [Rhodoplanes elegans]
MPTVAIIDGVKIQFYAPEHAPPHFHAIYAEHRAQIAIGSLQVLKGGCRRPSWRLCCRGRSRDRMP